MSLDGLYGGGWSGIGTMLRGNVCAVEVCGCLPSVLASGFWRPTFGSGRVTLRFNMLIDRTANRGQRTPPSSVMSAPLSSNHRQL